MSINAYGQLCGYCNGARRATEPTDLGSYACKPCADELREIGDREDEPAFRWDGQE